jgi:hypothetical protein
MNKKLREHRRLFGDLEVVDMIDTEAIEKLRGNISCDVPLKVNWTWDYGNEVSQLRNLYEKGKVNQWNATTDLDWDIPVSKDEWVLAPEASMLGQLCAAMGLDEATQKAAAHDELAYLLSQLLHGEQAALQLCGQLTNMCTTLDEKSYAASQAIDEARHIEVFAKFIGEKLGTVYPVSPAIKYLLDELLAVDSVEKKTLGMQCLFEGTAVGIMDDLRKQSRNQLLSDMLRRVEQDESRHAAFGVLCMRRVVEDAEPEQMDEMEDWSYSLLETVQSSFGTHIIRTLGPDYGINPDDVIEAVIHDPMYQQLTRQIFTHTVTPNLRRLGLITERTDHLWRASGLTDNPSAERAA